MSEAQDAERRQLRGELVHAFLAAARYDEFEIGLLGDLSRVSPERVEGMLDEKLREMKLIEDALKHPWDFETPLSGKKKD
jgi:hypothetical protein